MTDKAKLPREVAESLEEEKENGDHGGDIEYIAWSIPRWSHEDGHRRVLFEFSANANRFFRLIDALRYGYEIEPEPITVTITPEMQDQLRQVYDRYRGALDEFSGEYLRGIRDALTLAGLTIPGIPPED